MTRDLRPLFDPQSVAILGASANPAKWGYWLARSALKGIHRRAVYLVNRNGGEILGQPSYRSMKDLPHPAELVVITVAAAGFEQAADEALGAGARVIVGITAGLGEAGDAGRAAEQAVAQRVHAAGALLVGPNCLGVADTGTELDLASHDFAPGHVGLISQSGNLALELALLAEEAGVGFSRFVSVGNQADLEAAELVGAFTAHDATRLIALYVEDFRDGRAFARAVEAAVQAGKPVVLLTVGLSQASTRAARSHTGALVSESAAVDAACAATGMVRVRTPRQLIDLAQALLMPKPMRGRRVAIVGDGGGHVALAADLLTARGLHVPLLTDGLASRLAAVLPPTAATKNPIDLAGGGEQDFFNFERTVRLLAQSGEADAVLLTGFFGGYSRESDEFCRRETEVAQAMAKAAEASGSAFIVQTMYPKSPAIAALRARRVPVYADIEAAVGALARMADRAEHRPTGVTQLPRPRSSPRVREGYFAARELMAGAGILFVDARRVASLGEARAAARGLGFPVVLKALQSTHKSDSGGVRVGIANDGELEAAFADLTIRHPSSAFSLERMAPTSDGVELLIGVRRDHSFGPVALIGLGGVHAELLHDVAAALAPLTEEVAQDMISSLRAAPLLAGSRGRPPLDVKAAAQAAVALSRLAAEREDIAETEVNPLLVLPQGVIALDARVVLVTIR